MKYRHISSLDLLLVIDSFVSSLIHPVFSSFTLYPFIFIPLFRSIAEKLFAWRVSSSPIITTNHQQENFGNLCHSCCCCVRFTVNICIIFSLIKNDFFFFHKRDKSKINMFFLEKKRRKHWKRMNRSTGQSMSWPLKFVRNFSLNINNNEERCFSWYSSQITWETWVRNTRNETIIQIENAKNGIMTGKTKVSLSSLIMLKSHAFEQTFEQTDSLS